MNVVTDSEVVHFRIGGHDTKNIIIIIIIIIINRTLRSNGMQVHRSVVEKMMLFSAQDVVLLRQNFSPFLVRQINFPNELEDYNR